MVPEQGIINFHLQSKTYKLSQRKRLTAWVLKCIENQGFVCGEINVIFCTEHKLLKINKLYLNHHDHTDIITFDHTIGNIVSGDLYISYNRVKENALNFNTSFQSEILRVTIHGVLHLMGYKDKSKTQREEMRAKEDQCLSLFQDMFHVKH